MFKLIAYIKFLLHASNQHGVHSPFVFKFITACLYDKRKQDAYAKLKAYRKYHKNSKKTIEVLDFGAGSKTMDKKKRRISQMVKVSSSTKRNTKLLYRVARYFKVQRVLELGTSLGLGTYALALANPKAAIQTIEGCPNTSDVAKLSLEQHGSTNIEFLKGQFSDIIPKLQDETYDLVFFDGHHNKTATINNFLALVSKAHNDSVFIFDDIYWSKGMSEAWHYIKSHPKVSVTIDCYYLGFAFFRCEQVEQHFRIRL